MFFLFFLAPKGALGVDLLDHRPWEDRSQNSDRHVINYALTLVDHKFKLN